MIRVGAWVILLVLLASCSNSTDEFDTFDGKPIQMEDGRAKVFMFLAPDCPLCQTYSTELVKLNDYFKAENVDFYGVMPGKNYTREEVTHFIDSFQFKLPLLMDQDYKLTNTFEAKVTPEFFLVDSNQQVLYRGLMDDWAIDLARKRVKPSRYYLQNAIEAYLSGDKVEIAETEAVGCVLEND
ncbi:MAG: redoxin family protein [Bacteroidia bacterium]|nr:redoxin family protein [Bacteroidia bacterium]